MPYAVLEKMYTALSLERQKEAYDFICYLFEKKEDFPQKKLTPRDSYSADFFDLFGSCTDDSFVEPEDFVVKESGDELF